LAQRTDVLAFDQLTNGAPKPQGVFGDVLFFRLGVRVELILSLVSGNQRQAIGKAV
jgi:hypothetical protein